MKAVKVHIKLEPDSLVKNPKISPFIGKNVELTLIEENTDNNNQNTSISELYGSIPDFPEREPQGELQDRDIF